MAVSFVVSFPMEQVVHRFFYGAGSYWLLHSCNTARIGLDLGNILQAILTPILVFLLPGPGSILRGKVARSSSLRPQARTSQYRPTMPGSQSVRPRSCSTIAIAVIVLIVCLWVFLSYLSFVRYWFIEHPEMQPHPQHSALVWGIALMVVSGSGIVATVCFLLVRVSWQSFRFIAAGWLFGGAIPILWWHGLGGYAQLHGLCTDLFDLGRFVSPSAVDDLSDCAHYFIGVSIFAALWSGITAGGLRLQSARAAEGSLTDPLGRYQTFYWAYLLGWVVQYRLSQSLPELLLLPWARTAQGWVGGAFVLFYFVTVSSLWALAFPRFLWKQRASTQLGVVIAAFAGSFVIYILTAVVSVWLWLFAAGAIIVPLMSLNVFGLAWAMFVGKWYLRAQRELTLPVTNGTPIAERSDRQLH